MTDASTKRNTPRDSAAHGSDGLHSLLVPVDLTPTSDRALRRIPFLPLVAGAQVTLLHVVPGSLSASEQRRAERDAHKALADEARHLSGQLASKVSIEPVVAAGNTAKEIAACATKVKGELIVMGRGGGRALRDAFLGSTAERVTRQTRLPVLVVRLAPRAAYSRPALALDLDPCVQEVVRLALTLLPSPRPRVDVIHAFDTPYQGLIYPSLSEADAQARKDDLRFDASQKLAKVLTVALAKANARGTTALHWKTHVRYGSPRLVVEKFVEKAETDLLVLGTHGHSGPALMLLGTVAGDLLREARCDVLIVPPPHPRA